MIKFKGFLSGNVIKIIAAVAMVIDHAGVLFNSAISQELYTVSRSIGRLAFPLFAFMIAEGCRYTKDRKKYFLSLFLLGLVCNSVYYVAMQEIYSCVLTTFSASVLLIFTYDGILKSIKEKNGALLFNVIKFATVVAVTLLIIKIIDEKGGTFDYGITGALLPLLAYIFKNHYLKVIAFAIGLLLLCLNSVYEGMSFQYQWFSFASIILLLLYSGERGRLKMKNFFYLFYPLHLVALEGIYLLINLL